jgi:hypothetical protein
MAGSGFEEGVGAAMTAERNVGGHPKGREMVGAAIANTAVLWQSLTPRNWGSPGSSVMADFRRLRSGRAFRGLHKGTQL